MGSIVGIDVAGPVPLTHEELTVFLRRFLYLRRTTLNRIGWTLWVVASWPVEEGPR
jgi:hypothetical protein